MRETQVTFMIVAPQALTNGVEVVKPIILAHSRVCSCHRPLRCRPNVESQPDHTSNDNYGICLDSVHIDSLLPLLQGMQYMDHNPRVRLLMITVCTGMLSPMETTTCNDVTYTALAGSQLNCPTLGIAKFLLVH